MGKPTALQALRQSLEPITWIMGVSSVLMGTAAALLHGNFEPIAFSLCIFFVLFAHAAGAFYHRYTDQKYSFGENIDMGIAHYTDSGISTEFVFKEAAIASFLVASTIGIALAAMAGWEVLVIGVVLWALIMVTVGGPSPLMRRSWVLVITFIVFGPIGVIASCLVQSQHTSFVEVFNWYDLGPAVFLSVASGLMACNCHLMMNFMQYNADKHNSKNSFIVKNGKKASSIIFIIDAVGLLLVMVAMFIVNHPTQWGVTFYAPLLALPVYWYVSNKMKSAETVEEWRRLEKITFYIYLGIAVVTLILFGIVGAPSDSHYQYI